MIAVALQCNRKSKLPRPLRAQRRLAGPLLVGTILIAGITLSQSDTIGLYHDDGIYVASGRSLSERGTYTLANLPTEPPATKYPPLYPALLALAALAPGFLPFLAWAKSISAVALAALTLLTWRWLREVPGTTPASRVAGALLVGLNPGLLSHVDLLLSDVLFATLSTAALWTAASAPSSGPLMARAATAGLLAGLATLTRAPGVVPLAVVLCRFALTGRWRVPLLCGAAAAAVLLPWWVWRESAALPSTPLLEYYVAYEPQAWRHLLGDPARLAGILSANLWFFLSSAGLVLGLPGLVLTVIGLVLAGHGAWRLRGSAPGRVAVAMTALYLAAIIGHPYPMARYLLPLVPMFWVLAIAGLPARLAPSARAVALIVAFLPIVLWLRLYATLPPDAVHGGFGRPMAYPVSGFVETAAWIRRCTSPHARIASAHDPYYYLATGRRAVRPWIHRPETYTPAYGRYLATPNPPSDLQAQLDGLGVSVLIRDPLLADGEGEYGRRAIDALLGQSPAAWRRAWASANGRHEVFLRGGGGAISSEDPACAPDR